MSGFDIRDASVGFLSSMGRSYLTVWCEQYGVTPGKTNNETAERLYAKLHPNERRAK